MSEYGLVMPFVVCESQGGPFDDQAFTAGFECGRLDVLMSHSVVPVVADQTVRTENLPQLDLIAMRHGFSMESADGGVEAWSYVTFRWST